MLAMAKRKKRSKFGPKIPKTYRFSEKLIEAFELIADESRRSVTAEIEIAMEERLKKLKRLPEPVDAPESDEEDAD